MMNFVTVEKGLGPEGRIAVVRFDRGDGINALSPEAMRQLTQAARSFEDDAGTSVVVLTGGPKAFSAGFDLKDAEGRQRKSMDIGTLRRHLRLGPRLARAWREIGLAAGEPPTRRGYPPSVFAALPRLLERAAPTQAGTITGFYTVLAEGELASDPIAEEVKSILDGHLILSSKLAEAGHYPAIDVLASGSRVMDRVVDRAQRDAAIHLRRLLARHDEIELLVRIGEYQAGSDPLADEALRKIEAIRAFLRETEDQATPYAVMLRRMRELAA